MIASRACRAGYAGSRGRDTRGLIGLRQSSKVRLVRICDPHQSGKALEVPVEV
jgi:seryl-tRNA synthetase